MKISIGKLQDLIKLAESAHEAERGYVFLPEIIETLRLLLTKIEDNALDRFSAHQIARGLGRLVTEDFNFSESELGGKLLKLVDELTG